MHTAVGNDINEQMIVNRIDDLIKSSATWQLPNFNHNILNSFIMIR